MPRAKKKLEQTLFEKELKFYQRQVERYPGNLAFRYELGYRYMLTKRYTEAIQELQKAKNDPRRRGVCLLVAGAVLPADQAVSVGDEPLRVGDSGDSRPRRRQQKTGLVPGGPLGDGPERPRHGRKAPLDSGGPGFYLPRRFNGTRQNRQVTRESRVRRRGRPASPKRTRGRKPTGTTSRRSPRPVRNRRDARTAANPAASSRQLMMVEPFRSFRPNPYTYSPPVDGYHAEYQECQETTETKPRPPRAEPLRQTRHPHRVQESGRGGPSRQRRNRRKPNSARPPSCSISRPPSTSSIATPPRGSSRGCRPRSRR